METNNKRKQHKHIRSEGSYCRMSHSITEKAVYFDLFRLLNVTL